MRRPPSASVKVFDVPVAPSTHRTAHATPLTVAPLAGWVTGTRRPPPAFVTVTGMLRDAVRPIESVTVADSVCGPLVVVVVSQAKPALVPAKIGLPSSRTWYE